MLGERGKRRAPKGNFGAGRARGFQGEQVERREIYELGRLTERNPPVRPDKV